VTGSFDREPSNSVEQTFTVVVFGFMIAPEKRRKESVRRATVARAAIAARGYPSRADEHPDHRMPA
jgi:hypothetical protein